MILLIHILQTIFLEDVINQLEDKYKQLIPNVKEKNYIYANIFKLPLYYKLFAFKPNPDYGLYNKFLRQNNYEIIDYSIKIIQENNYNKNQVLFLYSYICNIVFSFFIDEYINYKAQSKKRITKKAKMIRYSNTAKIIEAQFYEERFYTSVNKFRININELKIDDEVLILLDEICGTKFLMSYGIDILEKGFENFKIYQTKNYNGLRIINKLIAKIGDLFSRSKKYSASSIFNITLLKNNDYLNKENKMWIKQNKETTQSFYELYEDTINFAVQLLTTVCEKIYYQIKNDNLIIKKLSLINKE